MATSDDEDPRFNKFLIAGGLATGGIVTAGIIRSAMTDNPPMAGEAEAEAAVHASALQNVGSQTGPAEGAFCTNSVDHIYGTICSETPAVETTTEVASNASVGLFDIITSIF